MRACRRADLPLPLTSRQKLSPVPLIMSIVYTIRYLRAGQVVFARASRGMMRQSGEKMRGTSAGTASGDERLSKDLPSGGLAPRLYQRAYGIIRSQIAEGVLAPGAKLTESAEIGRAHV